MVISWAPSQAVPSQGAANVAEPTATLLAVLDVVEGEAAVRLGQRRLDRVAAGVAKLDGRAGVLTRPTRRLLPAYRRPA